MQESSSLQGVSVHDGFPNPATDSRLQGLDLNGLLINHSASTYLMQIEGHQWQSMGIFHGDIAVIDRALSPKMNDLVVWWRDGFFTISVLREVTEDAEVWGMVTATIHRYWKGRNHND